MHYFKKRFLFSFFHESFKRLFAAQRLVTQRFLIYDNKAGFFDVTNDSFLVVRIQRMVMSPVACVTHWMVLAEICVDNGGSIAKKQSFKVLRDKNEALR